MQPGLTRAVPMGIVGFLIGAGIVLTLRLLQGLDPVWDAEIGVIVATFTASGLFVWGMGAFDPKMSAHPHEPPSEYGIILADEHEEAHEDEEEADEPTQILGWSIWQVSFWTTVVIVVLFGVATLPTGFTLQISHDPAASFERVGYFTMELPFGGPEIEVSQLTAFVGFVIFTLASLALIGGAIALGMAALSQGVTLAKAGIESGGGVAASDPQERNIIALAQSVVITLVVLVVLYVLFYYVFIGMVIPQPEWLLVALSLGNALVITLLVRYPTPFLRVVGKAAGWLARVLRGLPGALGQK
jgi:hypothetical protein